MLKVKTFKFNTFSEFQNVISDNSPHCVQKLKCGLPLTVTALVIHNHKVLLLLRKAYFWFTTVFCSIIFFNAQILSVWYVTLMDGRKLHFYKLFTCFPKVYLTNYFVYWNWKIRYGFFYRFSLLLFDITNITLKIHILLFLLRYAYFWRRKCLLTNIQTQ